VTAISTTPPSELSDHELIQEVLILRGPWGEVAEWLSGSERTARQDRSVLLQEELQSRSLRLPSQQSIGRAATSYSPEELEIWEQLVREWDGTTAAPKGEDARLALQEV
jgi:hypothetical protein